MLKLNFLWFLSTWTFIIAHITNDFFFMALTAQSQAIASSFLRFFEITDNDTPESVGLLWTSDQPVAETST